jgi:hypothetical protein
MRSHSTAVRRIVTTALLILLGLLVLQALAYGIGFAIDPAGGVGEFGQEPPPIVDDLTVGLVGLIGVGMLGMSALLTLSAVLIWRGIPTGATIAMVVGGVYLLAGMSALRAGWMWDAYFYGITGPLLIALSTAVRVAQTQTSETVG